MNVTKIPKKTISVIEPKRSLIVNREQYHQRRVAAYCRVSTDSEEQLTSYTNQKKVYTEMIAAIESHEAEFKELSDTIELLQGRIQKLEEALASDQANDSRILQLQQIIADRASKKMEYDDTIVHQMIECVKVYPDGRLDIIFGGGYLIEERLEKES